VLAALNDLFDAVVTNIRLGIIPRLDAAVFVVRYATVPSYSTAPAAGVVRIVPDVNLNAGIVAVPAAKDADVNTNKPEGPTEPKIVPALFCHS
jgi:hypothetical protein